MDSNGAAYHHLLHVRAIPLVFKVDGKHDGRATIDKGWVSTYKSPTKETYQS